MDVISNYFWIFFVLITLLNVYILRSRVQPHIDKNHELQAGYDKLFKAILVYGTIPWLIMGAGIVSGSSGSMFDFINPTLKDPFVIAFHAYIVFLYLLLIRWLFFKKGAEFLAQHPGLIVFRGFGSTEEITSVRTIKLFFLLALAGGFTGECMMWGNQFKIG